MHKKLILLSLTMFPFTLTPAWDNFDRSYNPSSFGSPYEKTRRLVLDDVIRINEVGSIIGHYAAIAFKNEYEKSSDKNFDKIFDKLINKLKEQSKNGGEVDKLLKEWLELPTRNANRVIDGLVHRNLMKASAIGVTAAAALFVAMYGVPLGFKMIERALMKPKLIIASSKKSRWESLFGVTPKPQDDQIPMIFPPKLETRLNELVTITKTINTKINEGKTNIKYRNLMLYGPPGTGKTLFAKELAKRCGMDYAFMSGSSFSKFKDGEGIEALDELFAWANKCKGLLIFIDEAETFLSKRENMDPQSKAYLLLNNFLNYTGTKSSKFMIVFATNHKDTLDSAMYRRIDDLVEMPLPGLAERIRILDAYKNIILLNTQHNEYSLIQSASKVLTKDVIKNIATQTKGLSGSELEGIMNNLQTNANILNPSKITLELVNAVVQQAIEKHQAFTAGKFLGFVEN